MPRYKSVNPGKDLHSFPRTPARSSRPLLWTTAPESCSHRIPCYPKVSGADVSEIFVDELCCLARFHVERCGGKERVGVVVGSGKKIRKVKASNSNCQIWCAALKPAASRKVCSVISMCPVARARASRSPAVNVGGDRLQLSGCEWEPRFSLRRNLLMIFIKRTLFRASLQQDQS